MDTRNECPAMLAGSFRGVDFQLSGGYVGEVNSVEVVLAARLAAGPIETVAVQ
jgi:hypothetical protein